MRRRTVGAAMAAIALILSLLTSPAYAQPTIEAKISVTVKWYLRNSALSKTGAIFHTVKNDQLQGAKILERGMEGTARLKINTKTDKRVGVKVWQPAGYCTRVYKWVLYVWIRKERYQPQGEGRDVWAARGIPTTGTGRTFMVKITPGKCP